MVAVELVFNADDQVGVSQDLTWLTQVGLFLDIVVLIFENLKHLLLL